MQKYSPFQLIVLSFAALLGIGTAFLMLPIAGRGETTLMEALFTATSAATVTGLTVVNTAEHWSPFGQAVILLLIQIGGLGVVTMAVAITMASGRKINLMERNTMQEAVSANQLGGIVRLLRFILLFTVLVELLGAALLVPTFCGDYGIAEGLWMAVFHAISAFCNAGFDLLGTRDGGSLIAYAASPIVNCVIMGLIIAGGLGFLTWADIRSHRWHFSAYRLQTKVILCTTVLLIILPALFFLAVDFHGEGGIWRALFQSVTARTAGYNTADLTAMSEGGRFLLVILMLIGGAPGSTAGGIKVTTAAVLFFAARASLRRKRDVTCFRRRVPSGNQRNALTIFLVYFLLFLGSVLFLMVMDGVSLIDSMMEVASAMGTVGLSFGLTERLSAESQCLLIVLMYFGRVGALTMIYAMNVNEMNANARLPEENITVG